METLTTNEPTKLRTEQMGELAFRRAAGLCIECGEARAEANRSSCAVCIQRAQIATVKRLCHTWGIAA